MCGANETKRMDRELSCCASGSRRSAAAAVVVNSLGAVDLVAAVVSGDHQARVARSVREALGAEPGLRVLSVESRPRPERWRADGDESGRTVLLWEQVDVLIEEDPHHFQCTAEELCRALASREANGSGSRRLHRAVLIGGRALAERLEALLELSGEQVRFRYILVE